MVHARLHGAVDGHGPHAEERRGVDKALHKAVVALSPDQPAAEQLPYPVHPLFDVDGLPQQGAHHHAHDDAQAVRRGDHAGDADAQHAQAQGKGEARGEAGADAVFEYQSQYAPQNDQDHVDHGGNHGFSCFHTAMR